MIEKIRIGHDGKGIGARWFLDKVEIRRLLEDNKSATLYTFPCKRWLAKGEDDGAIVRELVLRNVTEEIVDKDGEVVSNKVEHQSLDGKKLTTASKSFHRPPTRFEQLATSSTGISTTLIQICCNKTARMLLYHDCINILVTCLTVPSNSLQVVNSLFQTWSNDWNKE